MKPLALLVGMLAVVLLAPACAPASQTQSSTSMLRNYPRLAFVFNSTDIGAAVSTDSVLAPSFYSSGERAAFDLAAELQKIGFTLVGADASADAVVEFSVEFNPGPGRFVDDAFVRFRDQRNREVIAGYVAKRALLSFTVSSAIVNLARQIRQDW